MWVYRNNPHCSNHPIVLYDWQQSRRADHPREFLKSFSGTVVTDGYQVYHTLGKERQDLKISGCRIHCRRPYAEFIKSVGATAAKGSIAAEAYAMITEIMHLDNSINQEECLRMFLTDGRIPMDNNYAEQAIRPFTIARKNFVLMESDHGAKVSAMIFSIVETAKANNLNTYEYFEHLLSEIPKHQNDKNLKFLDNLLPWSKTVQKKCPSRFKKS